MLTQRRPPAGEFERFLAKVETGKSVLTFGPDKQILPRVNLQTQSFSFAPVTPRLRRCLGMERKPWSRFTVLAILLVWQH